MRAANAFLASAVASITASTATAFLPPLPRAPGSRVAGFSCQPRRVTTSLPGVAVENPPPQEVDPPLPPKDETFNPFRAVKELLALPGAVEDAGRYDRVGRLTGGVWRTIPFGCTVVTFQQGSKWIVKQEAAGNIYKKFPRPIVDILGEKWLGNLNEQPKLHAIGRKPYSDALSAKGVLEMQPFLETVIRRKILKLEGLAKSGQELIFQDELSDITLEVIAGVFFGDYATPELTEDITRYLPAMLSSLVSIPIRFPWPLNKIRVLGFGRSMDAREALKLKIIDVLEKRRADLTSSAEKGRRGGKSPGLLDSFMKIKQDEMGTEAGRAASFFDDDFIVDNVINTLFAGRDTMAVTLARLLQLIKTSDDGAEITDKLIQELSNDKPTENNVEPEDATLGAGSGGVSRAGILAAFPLLDAVILESFRLYPSIPAALRKSRVDVTYNGYLIPEGKFIICNIVHGLHAESLYSEPKKFCPFRFLHGGEKFNDKEGGGAAASSTTSSGEAAAVQQQQQPPPPMYGAGKHICPARELAKLEVLLFLKEFLPKFDYELVEGQSFKGTLPLNGPKDGLRVILKLKSAA